MIQEVNMLQKWMTSNGFTLLLCQSRIIFYYQYETSVSYSPDIGIGLYNSNPAHVTGYFLMS